jgi:hypothetical protein
MDSIMSVLLYRCGILPESYIACRKACAKHDDIARSTGAEVENALGGTDSSDLRVSFRWALSFSTPPLTLYRNYRPGGCSNRIFGVPLVDDGINEDKVPKVMRMCIDEVEKRGLNIDKIYSVSIERCFRMHAKCPSRVPYMTNKFGRPVEFTAKTSSLADANLYSVAGQVRK